MRCDCCNECIKYPSPASKKTKQCGKCRRGIDTNNKGRFNEIKYTSSLVVQ
ncbi:hypothetical protein HOV56_gp07 [Nitrosopumilus spindle-shaped virus]|uniref:Uncharacterized protein n=1 Tax=Nitrosopumilus spindle-shaped virus TaxID=2508184 RepID=A0A514K2T1_9VIRU|nr:hypothetical protein HOV56_gp07 [Nitrosopumilus spindle-shaped virus]YP_010772837.1 hypothetical protein QIT54_gp07 [Nitrosopumilus spindle-shaped virus]QDI73896.1 hypothetical protein [Nitrosopumilus spindle-shaped virus]QDI73945.1 hypothetical protein [Nitrosopumilus spindle-shaped virus]